MHYSPHHFVLLSLLRASWSAARPAPQIDATPCPTTVFLPGATLTVSPTASTAIVNGLPDGISTTLEVNGTAISIGSSALSLNQDHDLVLDGHTYLFAGACPAMLIPVTVVDSVPENEPASTPSPIVPIVPGQTDPSPDDEDDESPFVPLITIPIPNNPDTETPNTDNPDTNTPENPETDTPDSETDNPDPDSPDNNAPDDDTPDNDTPDNDIPDRDTPIGPIAPVITPPPTPPAIGPADPNDEDPEECEIKSASICTQGCSFGVDNQGVTTTTSCADPTCTATTGCTVSDTTSTTTIKPDSCPLHVAEIASDYPFETDGNGPLPILRPKFAGAPAPTDPQPTPEVDAPEQPETEPQPGSEPEPAPEDLPIPGPNPDQAPQQIYEVGDYIGIDGIKYFGILRRDRDSKINVCLDWPIYAHTDLSATFDLPNSYASCKFDGIGGDDLGIFCEGKDKVPCSVAAQSSVASCLGDSNLSFGALWVCNE
ncbi:hypothetical protein T440DRAFT_518318 [Plenodomus tracheiphilus IPT5]|uniref:Uncharacterized protein n=1 Tax=Plenodomus tracheiphilus IPT5 TaxID=1408161 RepID=A0A6A7B8A3_9PLEO|nr:hypothetical protein T440DRAFT_518318 [Plenodomus tracheiphilus IPT5]